MSVINRIIGSKKFILTTIPVVANIISQAFGWALPTDPVMFLIDGAFGLLVGIQGVLDWRHGSKSDGTAVTPAK